MMQPPLIHFAPQTRHIAVSSASQDASGARSLTHVVFLCVQVMLRRSGREDRSREVQVPVSSAVAAAVAERAAAEAAERAHIKRLTLQVHHWGTGCNC